MRFLKRVTELSAQQPSKLVMGDDLVSERPDDRGLRREVGAAPYGRVRGCG